MIYLRAESPYGEEFGAISQEKLPLIVEFPPTLPIGQRFQILFRVFGNKFSEHLVEGFFEIAEKPIQLFPKFEEFSIYEASFEDGEILTIRGSFPRSPVVPKVRIGDNIGKLMSYSETEIMVKIPSKDSQVEINVQICGKIQSFQLQAKERKSGKRKLNSGDTDNKRFKRKSNPKDEISK